MNSNSSCRPIARNSFPTFLGFVITTTILLLVTPLKKINSRGMLMASSYLSVTTTTVAVQKSPLLARTRQPSPARQAAPAPHQFFDSSKKEVPSTKMKTSDNHTDTTKQGELLQQHEEPEIKNKSKESRLSAWPKAEDEGGKKEESSSSLVTTSSCPPGEYLILFADLTTKNPPLTTAAEEDHRRGDFLLGGSNQQSYDPLAPVGTVESEEEARTIGAKLRFENSITTGSVITPFCGKCPPGHYCTGGSSKTAHACPAGEYQPSSGMSSCYPCGVGTYQPSTCQTRNWFPCSIGAIIVIFFVSLS
jgi:hypothetical protein